MASDVYLIDSATFVASSLYDEKYVTIYNEILSCLSNDFPFEKLIELSKKYTDNPLPYYYIGYLYHQKGEIQQSFNWYRKCIKKFDSFVDAYLNIATIV